MSSYKTSVVIPGFNGRKFFEKNLPDVLKLGVDEVIVVDDASTDDTVQFLSENYPQIVVVKHGKNKGFPISVNDGFKKTTGEVIFLLNQDLSPDKDLLKHTLPHFKQANIFAVTFAEQDRSWADAKYEKGFLQFTNGEKDSHIHNSFWASGGSAAFRKSLWNKFEGFDPIFSPGYYEDLDLGWRATKSGYQIIWDPKCKVDHDTETAFKKAYPAKKLQLIKERNYLLAHWKNLSADQLVEHFYYLALRILKTPGFIKPVLLALWKKSVS